MRAAKMVFLGVSFLCFVLCGPAMAQEEDLRQLVVQLQKRVEELEKKIAEQDANIKQQDGMDRLQEQKLAEYQVKLSEFEVNLHRIPGVPTEIAEGLELGAGMTLIVQGASNVNNVSEAQKKKDRIDGSYSADIILSKEFKEIGGRAFLHLEGGQGGGLEDDLTVYSNVNRDADNHENVRVTELWYEQELFSDRVLITFGKLDPTAYFDVNEAANDETTQFLGRIFRNSPALEFTDNTEGIRAAYIPCGWFEVGAGAFNGNVDDWGRMFDNVFSIGQIRFMANFFARPGNYRFYGWYNNVNHTKWLDTVRDKEAAYGFGLSFDQKLNDTITAFCRYGWQDPSVYNPGITTTAGDLAYSLEQSWSAGLQMEGRHWGRKNDVFGFAVGQIFPSADYRKAGASLDPVRDRGKAEGHIETYYKIYINKHLAVSPDLQYIWNPFGKDIADDTAGIFIGGMRAQVDF